MPPSLYLRNLRTLSGALSIPNSQRFILAPLTLTLSPGRGNRFVNADNMLQQYDSLKRLRGASSITTSHIFKPRDFPNPKP